MNIMLVNNLFKASRIVRYQKRFLYCNQLSFKKQCTSSVTSLKHLPNNVRDYSSRSYVPVCSMRLSASKSLWRQYTTNVEDLKLYIDDSAVSRMKTIMKENEFLRVVIEGGGCSGFQYKFEVDTFIDDEEDIVISKDDTKVVIDIESLKILNGSTVEYHTDMMRAGFRVTNIPQAEKGCSCGVSFAIKL